MESETINQIKSKAASINPNRREGKVAKAIEAQTSRIPSDVFLWTAGAAMATSLTLKVLKQDKLALFIGQWAAPVLLMGVYNKLVKQQGHDWDDAQPA